MKLTIFGTFLVQFYLLVKTTLSNGEISKTPSRNVYDVLGIVKNAVKVLETAHNFGMKNDFLLNNEVHEKLFKSDVIRLIPIFIKISKSTQLRRCFQDLWYLKEGINFKDIQNAWALQMFDSMGKLESGFLEGNFKWIGNFDECTNAYAPKKKGSDVGGYHGHYCTLQLSLDIIPITIGICLPETCNPSDFEPILNLTDYIPAIYKPNLKVKIDSLKCKSNTKILSRAGMITIGVISLFIFLVVLGSLVTLYKNYSNSKSAPDPWRYEGDLKSVAINFDSEKLSYGIPNIHFVYNKEIPSTILDPDQVFSNRDTFRIRNKAEKIDVQPLNNINDRKIEGFFTKCDNFLNCFCIFTNGSKLLDTKTDEDQLSCVHGIRFLSLAWVILSHVYLSPILFLRTLKDLIPRIDNLYYQVLLNAWYAVDSFFVLSGFLMSYFYFQDRIKRTNGISWMNFYLHRIFRLTPLYMLVLAFYSTVFPLLGSGPFWFEYKIEEHCQKTWWWNLLYINNFHDLFDECMPWTWYLANNMQFFVISPLFLITLWRWPKIGYSILAFFLCGAWISGFTITYYYGLVAGSISNPRDIPNDPLGFMNKWNVYTTLIYLKPYTRIAPYLIGIALGHILFKRRNASFKIRKFCLWLGWLFAVPVLFYCVVGLYGQTPGRLGASFYNALNRTAWGLGLAWIIFTCLSGKGGYVDRFLSYRYFIPLSRLTYCAYLIHPIFIVFYVFTHKTTIAFTNTTMFVQFLGLIIQIYASAILVSLIFESPLIRLEKLVKNKFQSRCKCS